MCVLVDSFNIKNLIVIVKQKLCTYAIFLYIALDKGVRVSYRNGMTSTEIYERSKELNKDACQCVDTDWLSGVRILLGTDCLDSSLTRGQYTHMRAYFGVGKQDSRGAEVPEIAEKFGTSELESQLNIRRGMIALGLPMDDRLSGLKNWRAGITNLCRRCKRLEKFKARIKKNPRGRCWLWSGPKTKYGYGSVTTNGIQYAHRVAYSFWNGPIINGLWVLHICDNPPCVNPNHLWLGTAKDNANDREEKGRGKRSEDFKRFF